MEAPISKISPELLEMIVGHLDKQSAGHLRGTAKAFYECASKKAFEQLALPDTDRVDRYLALSTRDRLARYVTSISFDVHALPETTPENNATPVSYHAALVSMICHLPNLRRARLELFIHASTLNSVKRDEVERLCSFFEDSEGPRNSAPIELDLAIIAEEMMTGGHVRFLTDTLKGLAKSTQITFLEWHAAVLLTFDSELVQILQRLRPFKLHLHGCDIAAVYLHALAHPLLSTLQIDGSSAWLTHEPPAPETDNQSPPQHLEGLLAGAAGLEYLKLWLYEGNFQLGDRWTANLPNLYRLELNDVACGLLSQLALPSLRYLKIVFHGERNEQQELAASGLTAVIRARRLPALQHIHFTYIKMKPETGFYRAFPELKLAAATASTALTLRLHIRDEFLPQQVLMDQYRQSITDLQVEVMSSLGNLTMPNMSHLPNLGKLAFQSPSGGGTSKVATGDERMLQFLLHLEAPQLSHLYVPWRNANPGRLIALSEHLLAGNFPELEEIRGIVFKVDREGVLDSSIVRFRDTCSRRGIRLIKAP